MSPGRILRRAFLSAALIVTSALAGAGDWPQWRGPSANGSSTETGLPADWGEGRHIAWRRPLPGEGASTPIIIGGRLYLTSADRDSPRLHAICLDAATGSPLWQRTIEHRIPYQMPYANPAACSPVHDGERAIFLFSTGAFFAVDDNGELAWERDLEADDGPLTHQYGYSASPLLHDGRLYLSVLRDDELRSPERHAAWTGGAIESFLQCIDPISGEELWRRDRPSEANGLEGRDSYATPLALQVGTETRIALIGADYLTLHDPHDGTERLRLRYRSGAGYRQRVVPTPLMAGGRIVSVMPRYGPMFAVDPALQGEAGIEAAAWVHEEMTPDTPSPLLANGRLYFVHDSRAVVTCLDPASGRTIWSQALEGMELIHASPTAADGKIYLIDRGGNVAVLATGDRFRQLGRIEMGEGPCTASIAVADAALYIRTAQHLYCVRHDR